MMFFGNSARCFLFLTILLSSSPVFCRPNFNIDPLFFQEIPNTRGCWGYVDPATGKEYALICATNRLEIWDVTNLDSVRLASFVPTAGSQLLADLKQVRPYKHYAVAVNQNGGSSKAALQIIDLQNPKAPQPVAYWPGSNPANPAFPNGAHTVHIEGDSAFLGMNGAASEWYVVDLSDPTQPTTKGTYMSSAVCGGTLPQSHDSYVKNDTAYIAFLSLGFSIVALNEKPEGAVKPIADVCYPGAFTHNCWPSEDRLYLFTTDEVAGGHLRVWDIRDPANPVQVADWMPPGPPSIIHNVQVKGDFLYAAYYTEGVSIIDIEDPAEPVEVGHFDTAPQVSGASFRGCWDFFPYFPSGTLLASNLSDPPGMWLLRFNETRAGKLDGTVVNWETGERLPGVSVQFVGLFRQTATDSLGHFNIRTGGDTVRLTFSKDGFRPETLSVEAFLDSTLDVDTIRLVPAFLLPTTPQGLTAQPMDGGIIELFWQVPLDSNLIAFRIYRTSLSDTNSFFLHDSVTPPETTYTDIGSTAGERFSYRVSAVNSLGFESFTSAPVKAMRFAFGPRLLLVNRTGPTNDFAYNFFRDSIQYFYRRALRRYDFDTLNLKDESSLLPQGIPPDFVVRNRAIFVHSTELRTISNDNPSFLSYFTDFIKAGGKLVMDGHWSLGGVNVSYMKCSASDLPFSISSVVWDAVRNAFGFDCLYFPRIYPFVDTNLVNHSFLYAQPQMTGYPLLVADSSRAAAGAKAFVFSNLSYNYPTVPNIGYFINRNSAEDLYHFGSISPGTDPKEGLTVAKRHLDPATGGGFVWFNFPLFYMQEDSAKKAIRRALSDLGWPEDFPKGDLNQDGVRGVADVAFLLNYTFLKIPFPGFDSDETDMNCDGRSSPADVSLFLLNIYADSPLPCD